MHKQAAVLCCLGGKKAVLVPLRAFLDFRSFCVFSRKTLKSMKHGPFRPYFYRLEMMGRVKSAKKEWITLRAIHLGEAEAPGSAQ